MRFKKIKDNFIVRFLAITATGLLLWKPLSVVYLHIITPLTNTVLSIAGSSVQLLIIDGVLKFQYDSVASQLLQFSVNDVDQIYLNILVFFGLVMSSYFLSAKYRVKYLLAGLGLLTVTHVAVLSMYTYTTIWDYVLAQPEALQASMYQRTDTQFSAQFTGVVREIIYLWNAWGWDVIPLLLWLPLGIKHYTKNKK